ncbi:MAG: MFS transporter [Chloroflexi bacterium]|nr:MFS transporter [Chloroflexota bacterium]
MNRLQSRISNLRQEYSPLVWILFGGELFVSTGRFLVFPFLAIYLNQRLGVSLTAVGTLLLLSSSSAILAQIVGGPFVDRFGRRKALLAAAALNIGTLSAFAFAGTAETMAFILFLSGLGAVFDIAINAMIADVTPAEKRQEAYGLMRIALNVGAAVGPAIGGFLVVVSYSSAFLIAAAAEAIYFILIFFRTWETKPVAASPSGGTASRGVGYGPLLRDGPYLAFLGALLLGGMAYAIPWVLLSVYLKTTQGIPENMFGLLVTINALMVVFFQYPVARWLTRFPKMPVLAAASLFTAIGAGSIAYFNTYLLFVVSMVVITIGELLASPTASAYVADAAPIDMRGRYMAAMSLSFGITFGLGPVIGGWLNDNLGPQAMWQGAMIFGLLSTVGFALLGRWEKPRVEALAPASSTLGE